MPDILFYEMMTGSEWLRTECFAKFRGANRVTLIPNVSTVLAMRSHTMHRAG
jgi:hypothetical protein